MKRNSKQIIFLSVRLLEYVQICYFCKKEKNNFGIMKERNLIVCLLAFFISVISIAQTSRDAQAVAKIYTYGVYYFNADGEFVRMQPLKTAGVKQKGILRPKIYYTFEGNNSTNSSETGTFYISTLGSTQSIDNFHLIQLERKNGQRWYSYMKVVGFGKVKEEVIGIPIVITELKHGVYKLTPAQPLSGGSYGLFYNYSNGVPTEIYDFDFLKLRF